MQQNRESSSMDRRKAELSEPGLNDIKDSGKNRYGIANQVIGTAFYGSVGWFKELDPGKDIPDFTIYRSEQNNIPCKHTNINENKQINYSF